MRKIGLAISVCLALIGCAAAPQEQEKPLNKASIERAEKSFQELNDEVE